MVDVASYRDIEEQFRTLQAEVENFSESLSKRGYAIALTRCDALSVEEVQEKTSAFIKLLGLNENKNGKHFGFADDLPAFCQDVYNYDKTLPYFVMPLSSITRKNLEAIKYALLGAITEVRKDESSS